MSKRWKQVLFFIGMSGVTVMFTGLMLTGVIKGACDKETYKTAEPVLAVVTMGGLAMLIVPVLFALGRRLYEDIVED